MSVHGLSEMLNHLANVRQFTDDEQAAAKVLSAAVERVFPKARVWTLLREDEDPALVELECIGADVSDMADTLAVIEDRLTALTRSRKAHEPTPPPPRDPGRRST